MCSENCGLNVCTEICQTVVKELDAPLQSPVLDNFDQAKKEIRGFLVYVITCMRKAAVKFGLCETAVM